MEQICGLELEFFVLGPPCPDVLAFIRRTWPVVPCSGKAGGFWLELSGPDGDPPLWCKVSGDGPSCTDDYVLEVSLPEANAPTSVWWVYRYVLPWLEELESRLQAAGKQTRLLMGPDLHGHRLAFQVNLDLAERGGTGFYTAMAPLLVSFGCLLGPGGPSVRYGYVQAPRLCGHSSPGHYVGDEGDLRRAPIAHRRYQNYGSPHRGHLSLEYPRLPGSMLLQVGSIALAALAYRLEPSAFSSRLLEDPIEAGVAISRSPEAPGRTRLYDGRRVCEMTGLDLQDTIRGDVAAVLARYPAETPAWSVTHLEIWEQTIRDVRAGELTLYSDWSAKRACLDPLFADAGVPFGSAGCRAAYAACLRLLRSGRDLDRLLAPECGPRPSRPAREFELDPTLAPLMSQALRLELGWARIGPASAVRRLGEHTCLDPLPGGAPYISPRAGARSRFLDAHRAESGVRVDWEWLEAGERCLRMGGPDSDDIRPERRCLFSHW